MLLTHYDFTHQISRNDFDQTKDSFDYRVALDAAMEEAFVSVCRALD